MWYELVDLEIGKVLNRSDSKESMAALVRQLEAEYPNAYPANLGLSLINPEESLNRALEGLDVKDWAQRVLASPPASVPFGTRRP